jgi:predicted nucleic acid-binding protein
VGRPAVSGRTVHHNAREESQSYSVHNPREGGREIVGARAAGREIIGARGPGKGAPGRSGAVLDAVTVIALMTPSNTHHKAALVVLHELAGTLKVIHPINMAEVLVKPAGQGIAGRVQVELTRAGIVTFTTSPAEPLALAQARATTGLKMPDVCAYVTALARGLPLVTFDRRLTIAARAAGIEVLGAPPEWQS